MKIRDAFQRGDPPKAVEVAEAVRHSPIPLDLRGFVADMLAGKIKGKPGRRRATTSRSAFISRSVAVDRVFRWKRAFERIKHRRKGWMRDPYREALNKVAGETSVPEQTLDKWCYPRGNAPSN